MGGKVTCHLSNSTTNDIWALVDSEREKIDEISGYVEGKYKEASAKVGGSVKFKWNTISSDFVKVPAKDKIPFDVPGGKKGCWVKAFSSTGESFGGPKYWSAENGTYFNVVFCPDYAMREGFKNKKFRVREGSQHYYGPFVCPGCRQQKCKYPVVKGSCGACKKDPDPNWDLF